MIYGVLISCSRLAVFVDGIFERLLNWFIPSDLMNGISLPCIALVFALFWKRANNSDEHREEPFVVELGREQLDGWDKMRPLVSE
jgi:hypothetical protein